MSTSFISLSKPSAGTVQTGMRTWVFRLLALAGGALFIVSWLIPWWRANIQEAGMYVQIRPWGLEHTLGSYVQYMGGDPSMPPFFAPLMWAYLVVAIAVLLVSLFVKEMTLKVGKWAFPLPSFLVFAVGVSYIIFVVVCAGYAYIRTSEFGVALVGVSYIVIGEFELGTEAISGFQPGYYLACVVGPVLAVLGLLRNKIVGKPKLAV